ncbi:MAG TPA: TerC family protein [Alphaproteobacteria bacterium]|nr:TerC family protein [Alphaproteobacteria bacterium]
MDWITNPDIWLSLVTLTALEIVLGIDNLVFIAILADRLPEARRPAARKAGLMLALVTRIALLLVITWIIGLTKPLFSLFSQVFSWRDLILIAGGLFLIAKGTSEMHANIEGEDHNGASRKPPKAAVFGLVVTQIAVMDIVFSIDSVVTAVGMARHVEVMAAAIVLAVLVMLVAANPVSDFVNRHPTVKMLALSFLLLVGVTLVADGLGFHIPKGYIYFAIGYAILVEVLNMLMRRRKQPAGASTAE